MPFLSNKSDRPYVKKRSRPFPHPRPSACICGSKERSTGASKRDLDLSPIRVHPRVSAVQKCDRPYVKKRSRPFPHPRPSACICGSKERSPLRQKERSPIFNY
ncbi:MAG: hypothetical protein ABI262_07885 [Microcoleus sp.]